MEDGLVRPTCNVNRRAGGAFTLVELMVVVAILAVLVALLISTTAKIITRFNSIVCRNNLHNALHQAGGAYTPVVNRGEGGGFWDTMGDDAQMYCFEKIYVEDGNPYRFWTYNEVMIVPPDATNTFALNATFSSSDADRTLGTWNKFRPGSDRKYTWEFGDGGNYAEPRCRDSCFRITFQEDGQTEVAIRCNRSRYSSWFRPSLVKPGATPSEDEVAFGDQGWAPAWSRSMDPEGYK
ncbi:hypothetical protein LCGC14_2370630, partial [marine sediment metagenome]